MNINDMIGKAKDLAAQHPDAVRSGLDKVEQLVDDRTGHAHTGMIAKAADAVEGTLGVRETPAQQTPGQTSGQTPDQAPGRPAGQPAPAQPQTSAQEPAQPQTPAQEQQAPTQGHTA